MSHRLSVVDGLDVEEVEDGLIVYDPTRGRAHSLNATAAVIFTLCDGTLDAAAVADVVATAYGFDEAPVADVAACLVELSEEGLLQVGSGARDVFGLAYEDAYWGGGSGQGARPEGTESYRSLLQCLIDSSDIRTVVDAGCGDWGFSRLIDWSSVRYLGVDVVPAVIEENRRLFGSARVQFDEFDLIDPAPPRADLLLCKDVLQHWPIALVQRFMHRIRGRYRYALVTNDIASAHCPPDALNSDAPLGGWRTLDLTAPPFKARPAWSFQFDVLGAWTKQALLLVSDRHKLRARELPTSGLNRLRRGLGL